MVVPMRVGDTRLTTDRWHEIGEEQRASEQERQRRELKRRKSRGSNFMVRPDLAFAPSAPQRSR
jgi:hypothetical protein